MTVMREKKCDSLWPVLRVRRLSRSIRLIGEERARRPVRIGGEMLERKRRIENAWSRHASRPSTRLGLARRESGTYAGLLRVEGAGSERIVAQNRSRSVFSSSLARFVATLCASTSDALLATWRTACAKQAPQTSPSRPNYPPYIDSLRISLHALKPVHDATDRFAISYDPRRSRNPCERIAR